MQKVWKYIKKHTLLVFTICLIISRIPCIFSSLHGINCDEAAIDYNIFCISEYGTDRYGNPFPVYFANQVSGQSALYTYLGVILTKLIGFSVEKCRLIKLASEIITFIFGGRLIKVFFNKTTETIFYFLYIICPYFFMMTGISFDCDLIIPVFILCMYLMEKCIQKGTTRWYVGLGICIGLLSYSYIIGILMVPLFLLVHFFTDKNKKEFFLEVVITFIVNLPIGYFILTLLGIAPAIKTSFFTIAPVSQQRLQDLGFSFDNLYRLKYCIITDPSFDFAGSSHFGTIYQISVLFLIIALIYLLRNYKENKRFFLYLGIAVIPLLLIKEATSYNYTVLYYFLLALTAAGIALLFHQYKTLGVITIAGYLIFFLMFCQEYFTTNLFIYSDDALIPVISKTETEQQIILDTTGVILPECYIGLALEANPKEIQYDNSSNAISFGNIHFNDYTHYKDYDVAILRNSGEYLYQQTFYSGLTDQQMQEAAAYYMEQKYHLKEVLGYYIFTKEE